MLNLYLVLNKLEVVTLRVIVFFVHYYGSITLVSFQNDSFSDLRALHCDVSILHSGFCGLFIAKHILEVNSFDTSLDIFCFVHCRLNSSHKFNARNVLYSGKIKVLI